ncbi:hypothetical protein METHPM2_670002 [Pseudomonas sp. PM2]
MLAAAQAQGLALHPCVKGYCRPDLPAHYREKIGFVLGGMAEREGQNVGLSSQSTGLRVEALGGILADVQRLSRSIDARDTR